MALLTTISPDTIAVALGRPPLDNDSPSVGQWWLWINDALMLIQSRLDIITTVPTPVIGQAKLDYVIREAVVAHARRPDDATQVSTSVDDASVSKTYRSSAGRVTIRDEWWTLLGLADTGGRAYAVDTAPTMSSHIPWCNLAWGANWCSCGADIAGSPIYELGGGR